MFLSHGYSILCKCSPFHSPIHQNTHGITPCSQDNIKLRSSGPAQIQVTVIIFPHLSFLPMNEALSAEEWDPYLPFGIVHVVTNQIQMSRVVALLPVEAMCVCEWPCTCHECVSMCEQSLDGFYCWTVEHDCGYVEIRRCWCKTRSNKWSLIIEWVLFVLKLTTIEMWL